MIAIVVSRTDEASEHVGERLLDLATWTRTEDESRADADGGGTVYRHGPFELRAFDALHLELDDVASAFSERPSLLAFASRHSGDTGPLLTAHFTGNFGPAEYGGRDDALATAAPGAQAALLDAFDEYAPDGYEVGMECTHHGPSDVGCPSLFVELGSDEAEWRDPDGATAVARAILDLDDLVDAADPDATKRAIRGERTVVGFGGGHYVPRFERIVRETPWTVGHVAADWGLDAMGDPDAHRDVLREAFAASDAEHALVEGTKPDLERVVSELGYRVVRETWLREVGDRDLDAVAAIEAQLGAIADGVRFGDRRPAGCRPSDRRPTNRGEIDDAADWVVCDLPNALLDAARAIDDAATRDAVDRETIAYQTRNNGSQAQGRAVLPTDDAYDALVDALVAVIEPAYDDVHREEDRVVATRTAFDPALAREAGVPEGPKFGRLANGDAVAVDGERIEPGAVRTHQEDVFEI